MCGLMTQSVWHSETSIERNLSATLTANQQPKKALLSISCAIRKETEMTTALLGSKRHEQMMLEALSIQNRTDWEAHHAGKVPSVDDLVRFYWEFGGGKEQYGED